MRIHELKIKEKYLEAIESGKKNFEYRKDRGYEEGDILALNAVDENGNYTGDAILVQITYIFRGEKDIPLENNYVIMAINQRYLDRVK